MSRADDRKKSKRKKERDERVRNRREKIREEARVKKEIERIQYKNRERIQPIRNRDDKKSSGS
jgi:hypothetical protein